MQAVVQEPAEGAGNIEQTDAGRSFARDRCARSRPLLAPTARAGGRREALRGSLRGSSRGTLRVHAGD
eukprot:14440005-Alexandrium_andersonii.AAC.1